MSLLGYSTNYQGVVDIFMRDPRRYLPFAQLLATIMGGESELSAAEREAIALHVSNLNDCAYCIGAHVEVLRAQGVDEATIASTAANGDPSEAG